MKIHNVCFPKVAEGQVAFVNYYICILLFLYPLFISEEVTVGSFTSKDILYYILTFVTGLLFIALLLCRRISYRRINGIDIICVLLIIFMGGRSIYFFTLNDSRCIELLILFVLITYFLTGTIKKCYKYYFDLCLFAALILYIGLLFYYIEGVKIILGVEEFINQNNGYESWLLTIVAVSSLLYCIEKRKIWNSFYLIMSFTGYYLLFLNDNILPIFLSGIFILIIPVILPPTVALIKRNLTLCFGFLFIYGNIPLFLFGKIEMSNKRYNYLYCLYIDLFLLILFYLIFNYWKRVPLGIRAESIIMIKFRRWYKYVLFLLNTTFICTLIIGSKCINLPPIIGNKIFISFSVSVLESLKTTKSFFQVLLENYGFLGFIIYICLIIMMLRRFVKQWNKAAIFIKISIIISVYFFIQTCFYQMQTTSMPMCVIFLTFALYADTTSKKAAEGEELNTINQHI